MADLYLNPYHMQNQIQTPQDRRFNQNYDTNYLPAPAGDTIALPGVRGMGGYMGGLPTPSDYQTNAYGQPAQAPSAPGMFGSPYNPGGAMPQAPSAAPTHQAQYAPAAYTPAAALPAGHALSASAPADSPSPAYTMQSWKDKGWIDQDGNVTLPWGAKVSVQQAMSMYYKDVPPGANEIPKWVEASAPMVAGIPMQYWNQLPADFRSTAQTWFDKAYGGGALSATPAVTNMQPAAPYHY